VDTFSHVIRVAKREKDRDYLAGLKIERVPQEDLRKWERFLDSLFRLKPLSEREIKGKVGGRPSIEKVGRKK